MERRVKLFLNPPSGLYTALTSVVTSYRNVCQRQDLQPPAPAAFDNARKLPATGVPLYEPASVSALLAKGASAVLLWTKDCQRDVIAKLDLDTDGVAALLREAVEGGRFIGSEWCRQAPDGPVAACDVYVLRRHEWNNYAHRMLAIDYYIKFAVSTTGAFLLIASCHLS